MQRDFGSDSLRRVLLRRLLWPLIPILLLGVVFSFALAQHAAVNAFDSGLLDDARDLARQIEFDDKGFTLDLPVAAADMLAISNEDRVIYAIFIDNGKLLAGDKSLVDKLSLSQGGEYEFRDVDLSGRLFRRVVLRYLYHGTNFFVVVAQTVKGRAYLLSEIFFSMLPLGGALVISSIAVVISGVRVGLKPVESLRQEIASRSPNDLQPLSDAAAPIELRPIIRGINELLAKLAASFAGYRRFIADAAHQLRTPLAALGSQLEVNLIQPPEDISALLKQLLATTQRTSHLANQLLSLARLEHSDGSEIGEKPVNLLELVQESAADFISRAARKSVEVEFEIEPLRMRGNALLLRELIGNLLDNAVRYAPENSSIRVSVRRRDDFVELVVADSGPGVAEVELKKLGLPFYRLPTSLPDGCGLGLAIVREIALIHRGDVVFENDSSGKGFCVRVRFPIAEM